MVPTHMKGKRLTISDYESYLRPEATLLLETLKEYVADYFAIGLF